MDDFFVFLLPEDADTNDFNFKIPVYNWQGVDYPQGPPTCRYGANFILTIDYDEVKFISKFFPYKNKLKNWKAIRVTGNGIDVYRSSLFNADIIEDIGYTLQILIETTLRNQPEWIVFFQKDFDDRVNIIEKNNADVVNEIQNCIKGKQNTGLLLYKIKKRWWG